MTDASDSFAREVWNKITWENDQMEQARLKKETRAVVRRLLNAWGAQTVPSGQVETALKTFLALVHGNALVVPDLPTERWADVRPGNVHGRDIVRVKRDAYVDDAGRAHNGRRGKVVSVRYGDVVVRYEDGREPPFEAVHHPPLKLEKLL